MIQSSMLTKSRNRNTIDDTPSGWNSRNKNRDVTTNSVSAKSGIKLMWNPIRGLTIRRQTPIEQHEVPVYSRVYSNWREVSCLWSHPKRDN